MKLATASQMREIDRTCIQERGIPGLVLMENAGLAVARAVRNRLSTTDARVAIICGKGNNGGDGFVAARHLHELGVATRVVLLARGEELKGDAASNHRAALGAGVEVTEATGSDVRPAVEAAVGGAEIVVDAILGTGVSGEVRGAARDAIEAVNEAAGPVIAVDVPSGVDSDSGRVLGCCVKADATVTFGLPKVGLYVYPSAKFCGEVIVDPIGIPEDVIEAAHLPFELIEPVHVSASLPQLELDAHKGDAGRLVVIAGSAGMTGAAALCCEAAMRMGAGLVTLCIPESLNDILEVKLTESMTRPMPQTDARTLSTDAAGPILELIETADAVVIGPGISTHEETKELVRRIVRQLQVPTLVDADGLNCLAQTPELLTEMPAPKVISPHPGELARLMNVSTAQIQGDRVNAALQAAERFRAVVALKGAGTIVAGPAGGASVNPTGNPGMASGGVGDVLSGFIGSLLAQGAKPFDAAVAAVYIHGLAGDIAAQEIGRRSLVAGDLIEALPMALERVSG